MERTDRPEWPDFNFDVFNGNDGRWIHNGRAVDFDNDDLNDLP